MPEVTPNIGENCHRAGERGVGGAPFFSFFPPRTCRPEWRKPPCLLPFGSGRGDGRPFSSSSIGWARGNPRAKFSFPTPLCRTSRPRVPLPAFCEPLPQSPSVPLLSASCSWRPPAPKGARAQGGRRQGLTAPWCLPSGTGDKDPVLSPCCPRLQSTQVSGGATLQVSNSLSWGKGHPWVQRLGPSPCPQSGWRHAG